MNDQRLNKALKITLILLLLSLVTIILLYLNITSDFQKRVECGELRPTSGEGAWVMQLLVFAYVVYLLVFICLLAALLIDKAPGSVDSRQTTFIVIILFSVLPTVLVLFWMCKASPNPFKKFTCLKTAEHEVRNGMIKRYAFDSVLVYEATILNDQKIGKEITRYENGVIASENNYVENVLHGECIHYYEQGNKRSVTTYVMGQRSRACEFYENGQMQYLFDEDSVYSNYQWWENGQLRCRSRHTPLDYWEQDGKQTLFSGNGHILIRDKTSGKKLQEQIYARTNILKEMSWHNDGTLSRVRESVSLSEKASRDIGCKDGPFSGYMDVHYYTNGKIESIYYNGTSGKHKSFYKSIRYDQNGKAL